MEDTGHQVGSQYLWAADKKGTVGSTGSGPHQGVWLKIHPRS